MKQLIISVAIAAVSMIAINARADGFSVGFHNDHAYIGLNFGDPWFSVFSHQQVRVVHPKSCHVVKNHRHGKHYYKAEYSPKRHSHYRHAQKVARYKTWKQKQKREARFEKKQNKKLYKHAYREGKKDGYKQHAKEERKSRKNYRGGRDWARAR